MVRRPVVIVWSAAAALALFASSLITTPLIAVSAHAYPGPSPAQDPPPASETEEGSEVRLVDRIVAVVDQDPIFQSEIEQIIDLGLAQRQEGEGPSAFRRRVLDELIERRLRYQGIGRFGTRTVTIDEIEAAVEDLRSRLAEQGEDLDAALVAADMTRVELHQLLARQLAVVDFVDRRLGPRVFISLEDIQSYYDQELVPTLERQSATIPPLDEVRETIRQVLRERRLNEQIQRWTEELRREADILVLIDDYPDELPPLRRLLEGDEDDGPAPRRRPARESPPAP